MKKLLLFFSLFSLILSITGCDWNNTEVYKIVNQTDYNIVSVVGASETAITPNEERIIYKDVFLGGNGKPSDRFYEYQDRKMLNAEMEIDGEPVPEIIWKRKYWNFTNEVRLATYTLVVTDELIESIILEE